MALTEIFKHTDPSLGVTTRIFQKANGELVIKASAPKGSAWSKAGGGKASGIGKAPKTVNIAQRPRKISASASKAAKTRHAGRTLKTRPSNGSSSQRCIVKSNITKASKKGWAAHANYIERDGQAFSATLDQDSAKEALAAWSDAGDKHMFKFIVSPESATTPEQLRDVVRETMKDLETGLGMGPLDWRAVIHTDTDHPHAHIVLRGKSEREPGQWRELKLNAQVLHQDMRSLFRETLTNVLGERTPAEIAAQAERQRTESYKRKRREIAKAESLPPPARKARIHEINKFVAEYDAQEAEKARLLALAKEQERLAEERRLVQQQVAMAAAQGAMGVYSRGNVVRQGAGSYEVKVRKTTAEGQYLESATVPGKSEQEVLERTERVLSLAKDKGLKLGDAVREAVLGARMGKDDGGRMSGDFVKTRVHDDDGR